MSHCNHPSSHCKSTICLLLDVVNPSHFLPLRFFRGIFSFFASKYQTIWSSFPTVVLRHLSFLDRTFDPYFGLSLRPAYPEHSASLTHIKYICVYVSRHLFLNVQLSMINLHTEQRCRLENTSISSSSSYTCHRLSVMLGKSLVMHLAVATLTLIYSDVVSFTRITELRHLNFGTSSTPVSSTCTGPIPFRVITFAIAVFDF